MEEYSLVLENPRRRRRSRRRTPPRGAGGRFRKRATRRRRNPTFVANRRRTTSRRRTTRRRRNPGRYYAAAANPRRRRRKHRNWGAVKRHRRRVNPSLFPRAGEVMGAVNKGTQILLAEFSGDLMTRVVGKFAGNLLMSVPMRPEFLGPVVRMGIGVLTPPLMKMLAPRFFKREFRQMFAAVNVASGLIGLTAGFREQAFAALKLPASPLPSGTLGDYYGPPHGVLSDYYGPPAGVLGDWVTAEGGIGDYVTAQGYPNSNGGY